MREVIITVTFLSQLNDNPVSKEFKQTLEYEGYCLGFDPKDIETHRALIISLV